MIDLKDVVAVDLKTHKIRMIAEGKTERNADAIETMAVMRRGCDIEFFAVTPHKRYKEGDEWDCDDD